MAETLSLPTTTDRRLIYESLIPQIAVLVEGETDLIANLANIVAAIREGFGFFWVGFYLKKDNQLVLGPFQGPIACTRINFTMGVCGACYSRQEIIVVPDVELFPGHIACSSASKSEIVLPVFTPRGEVTMVLDVDSDQLNDFSETDAGGLREVIKIVERLIANAAV
ncbi:GAF domain-containing protein [Runella sp.]|jgi:GAF domain-containing protein|uniref:GAF domain-containing protein n=1 Tax=Runella sp. TaxID=1960881 RepID=UPI002622261C|nr:GAF domain-containing protein [Runella sp.]